MFSQYIKTQKAQVQKKPYEYRQKLIEIAIKISPIAVTFTQQFCKLVQSCIEGSLVKNSITPNQLFPWKYETKNHFVSPICSKQIHEAQVRTAFSCFDCRQCDNSNLCYQYFSSSNHDGHRYIQFETSGCYCGNMETWMKMVFVKNMEIRIEIDVQLNKVFYAKIKSIDFFYFFAELVLKIKRLKQGEESKSSKNSQKKKVDTYFISKFIKKYNLHFKLKSILRRSIFQGQNLHLYFKIHFQKTKYARCSFIENILKSMKQQIMRSQFFSMNTFQDLCLDAQYSKDLKQLLKRQPKILLSIVKFEQKSYFLICQCALALAVMAYVQGQHGISIKKKISFKKLRLKNIYEISSFLNLYLNSKTKEDDFQMIFITAYSAIHLRIFGQSLYQILMIESSYSKSN